MAVKTVDLSKEADERLVRLNGVKRLFELRDVSSDVEDARGSEEAGRCGGGRVARNARLRADAFVHRAAEAELDGEAAASSRS